MPPSRSLASREQSKAEGLGPPALLGGGRLHRSGDFGFPQSSVRRAGEGGLVAVARLWLGSAVRQGLAVQWRVPAGSRKEGGRGDRRRGSLAPAGRAGPELGRRCAPPTLPSRPHLHLAQDHGLSGEPNTDASGSQLRSLTLAVSGTSLESVRLSSVGEEAEKPQGIRRSGQLRAPPPSCPGFCPYLQSEGAREGGGGWGAAGCEGSLATSKERGRRSTRS